MYLHSLGYLGVTSPRADDWPAFAIDVFGLEVDCGPHGTQRVRWDDRAFRLAVHAGPSDRLEYLGWETSSRQNFAGVIDRLERRGLAVHEGTQDELGARQVRGMVWVEDTYGIRHEFFHGAISLDRSFRGGRTTSSFVTGVKGLGHAVLAVPDLREATPFFEDVLGLRCSDIVDLGERGTMMFLRCNSRHHSIALWERTGLLGLQHLMVESSDIDDVGKAYDLTQASQHSIASTMGRHVGDEQLSFYTRSPSGFDLEFGCDSVEVVEAEWSMRYFDSAAGAPNEVWGHRWQHLEPQTSLHAWPGGGSKQ